MGCVQTVTGRNDRYAACIASAEKARLHTDLLAASTNIRVHGISDVVEKIVFDGDGGKSAKLVPIAELVVGEEESDTGKEDNKDTDNLSGSSGSSGGGAKDEEGAHSNRCCRRGTHYPVCSQSNCRSRERQAFIINARHG